MELPTTKSTMPTKKTTMLCFRQIFNLSNERPGRNVNRRIDLTVEILGAGSLHTGTTKFHINRNKNKKVLFK